MRKTFYFSCLFLLICSCSVNEPPVFIKVDNVKIMSSALDTVKIKAVAFFENPNDVRGNISTENLKIFVNNIEVAQVFSKEFNIPSKDKFSVPLAANIPTKNLLNTSKNGLLESLINSLLSNKVNIRIKGSLKYTVFGFKKEFLIDKTEAIKIKF